MGRGIRSKLVGSLVLLLAAGAVAPGVGTASELHLSVRYFERDDAFRGGIYNRELRRCEAFRVVEVWKERDGRVRVVGRDRTVGMVIRWISIAVVLLVLLPVGAQAQTPGAGRVLDCTPETQSHTRSDVFTSRSRLPGRAPSSAKGPRPSLTTTRSMVKNIGPTRTGRSRSGSATEATVCRRSPRQSADRRTDNHRRPQSAREQPMIRQGCRQEFARTR